MFGMFRSSTRCVRVAVGVLACVVLPMASRLEGSARFAWGMYARTVEFRIDLAAFDADGHRRRANPTALARHAAPSPASLLAGSDHWREGASLDTLRAHLGDLALYACRELGAARVAVTLRERAADRPERATSEVRACTP